MQSRSRRTFLLEAAAGLAAGKAAFARDKLERRNLGVELYTVRNVIKDNPAATLSAIKEIGYAEVEATYDNLDRIWSAIEQTGLRAVSVHVGEEFFTDKGGAGLGRVYDDVKKRGFEYVVVPSLPTAQGGADMVKRLATLLNKAGEQANTKGLTLCYHNHAHDFRLLKNTPVLEILLNETQPNLLRLELDIFWASVAGHNPAEVLKKYSGRVPLVHLKDKPANLPVQFTETVPPTAFKEVGKGSIDIRAVLTAAEGAGVKHYFVEQDQTPGDPIASLRQSYEFLSRQF